MADQINNSEILFIYECVTCNPNGDPDDENKPRMDSNSFRNLVSDVRLKRFIRDYLLHNNSNDPDKKIFVSKYNNAAVNAKTSLANILGITNTKKIALNEENIKKLLNSAIDIRMFGAIIPDVTSQKTKGNLTFTGPVQFNWGYSLNKVEGVMASCGITSHFHSGEQSDEGEATKGTGAMGKDYRLDYSLVAFYGIISGTRAKETLLKQDDIDLLDNSIFNAVQMEASTRSKIGHNPLLYLRIEHNGNNTFIGDLRKYVSIAKIDGTTMDFEDTIKLRSSQDYKLDLLKLKEKLENSEISKIKIRINDDLDTINWFSENENQIKIETIN